jgi:uncharacterized membrane protein YgdD (TMEM256/DUF423 family)
MHTGFLKAGAVFAVLSVMLGAFAAHAIKSRVEEGVLQIFETAVRYQMYHSIAIFISGILYLSFPTKSIIWAGRFFIIGIVLFSGSLYLLTYIKAIVANNLLWVGAITPFGGAAFITGWVFLFKSFIDKKA